VSARGGANGAPALELRGVTVRYGDVVALDGVDLAIAPGRICGVVGMNGSGKSTLFKSVMGLVSPDAGTLSVASLPPSAARKRGLVGYVPQNEDVDGQFPVSVADVVMMGRYGRMGPSSASS
jgi:manganese transport system ATP-binding protein